MRPLLLATVFLLATQPAFAQSTGGGGGSGGGGGTVTISGATPVNGNCSSFAGPTALQDFGQPCAAVPFPTYITGNWYYLGQPITLAGGGALTVNSIHCQPFLQYRSLTVQALAVRITTVSAGNNLQLAIYAGNAATGRPTGSALASTGSLSTTTATVVSAAASGTIPAGVNWECVNADNSVVVLQQQNNNSPSMGVLIGSATLANTSSGAAAAGVIVTTPQTFGTWPSLTGATWTESVTAGAAASLLAESN